MKLKELLSNIALDQRICVCDTFGAHNDSAPLREVPLFTLVSDLDREVSKIYYDDDDDTITIELEDELD